MTKALENLYSKREQLLNKGKSLNVETDYEAFVSNNAEIKKLDQMIEAQEEFEANEKETAAAASSASNGKNSAANNKKLFTSFSEQLRAIVNAGRPNGAVDPRLIRDDEKSDGTLNTTNNPDGGYAIQSDFLGNILEKAYERSPIISRCRSYTISSDSNRANYVLLDDSGDAAKEGVVVSGGVQTYWVTEGGTVTPSKPKIKSKELKLRKAMGLCYVTEEMLEDVSFTSQLVEDSFADALAGLVTDGILNGTGDTGNQPFGVLKSSGLVTVTPADSTKLTAKDFIAMKAAMRKKDWDNAAWFMHPDLEAELPLLNDGEGNLLFIPAGGLSNSQYDTLFGKPIIYDEFLSAKDSVGDILLANFDQYMLIKKGAERKEWSIHVRFLYDENTFRIVARLNGAPINDTTYSVRNSKTKRGSFVTLGKRTAAVGG